MILSCMISTGWLAAHSRQSSLKMQRWRTWRWTMRCLFLTALCSRRWLRVLPHTFQRRSGAPWASCGSRRPMQPARCLVMTATGRCVQTARHVVPCHAHACSQLHPLHLKHHLYRRQVRPTRCALKPTRPPRHPRTPTRPAWTAWRRVTLATACLTLSTPPPPSGSSLQWQWRRLQGPVEGSGCRRGRRNGDLRGLTRPPSAHHRPVRHDGAPIALPALLKCPLILCSLLLFQHCMIRLSLFLSCTHPTGSSVDPAARPAAAPAQPVLSARHSAPVQEDPHKQRLAASLFGGAGGKPSTARVRCVEYCSTCCACLMHV